jgi:UDP-N-acetylmuramate-alanine ligase
MEHVIESLLHLLSESVLREVDVEVVLVCVNKAEFAHAQAIRSSLMSQHNKAQMNEASHVIAAMAAELRDYARQLAELASSGHFALFLGAGVKHQVRSPRLV